MKILIIFLDGFGLGELDRMRNPLVRFDPPFFHELFGQPLTNKLGTITRNNFSFVPVDACLGIEGLPQSATGQTALFTGVNAAKAMGRHIQGFPGPMLVEIIERHGIMKQLVEEGYYVTSANMYTPNYHELVALRKRRHSVTTRLILSAGLPLRSLPEMEKGAAVYQDLTNDLLPELGFADVPVVTSTVAGERLIRLAEHHQVTMFEYFQTDRQGHKRHWDKAEYIVGQLNEFLSTIYRLASNNMLVVVTSDHGNFEDFSVKTHTRNAVPGLFLGHRACEAAANVKDLTDVAPALLALLRSEAK